MRYSEKDIVKGCKKGNRIYQKALVMQYSGMLLTVCRRYARDEAMAEDFLQESFIKIFRYIPTYKPFGSFEAWMRRIAINTSLQHLDRKYISQEKYTLDTIQSENVMIQDASGYLHEEELLALVKSLPSGFRHVFNLYIIDGYSHKEIADLLGINESTSRSQLARARKLLQSKVIAQKKIRV